MRKSRKKLAQEISNWTTEQDIYLIENSSLELCELCMHLPFSAEEIVERKEVLGLVRRDWQMRRFR